MLVLKNKMTAPLRMVLLVLGAVMLSACTTTENRAQQVGIKIEPSIIAVSTPGAKVPPGARFAWMQNAISLYKDERLDSTTFQYLIEKNIKSNLAEMGFRFVESESDADYTIAYTAALESALDDASILRRFGLVPGNMRIPDDNPMYEKGTLLIYAFDNRKGGLIWRSAVQAAVDFSLTKQERSERIEPIIRDMLHSLPTGK
jgi:hypothetical protein